MTITLPEEIRNELVTRASAEGFASVDEYVLSVVASDLGTAESNTFSPEERERLRALAEEGLNSPPIENPSQFLTDLVREATADQNGMAPHP
jgi:hypothetical protein